MHNLLAVVWEIEAGFGWDNAKFWQDSTKCSYLQKITRVRGLPELTFRVFAWACLNLSYSFGLRENLKIWPKLGLTRQFSLQFEQCIAVYSVWCKLIDLVKSWATYFSISDWRGEEHPEQSSARNLPCAWSRIAWGSRSDR